MLELLNTTMPPRTMKQLKLIVKTTKYCAQQSPGLEWSDIPHTLLRRSSNTTYNQQQALVVTLHTDDATCSSQHHCKPQRYHSEACGYVGNSNPHVSRVSTKRARGSPCAEVSNRFYKETRNTTHLATDPGLCQKTRPTQTGRRTSPERPAQHRGSVREPAPTRTVNTYSMIRAYASP